MSLIATKEYTSADVGQMKADYAARRDRLYRPERPAPVAPVVVEALPTPKPVVIETRGEFIELPNFLPVGRADLDAAFRAADSTVILKIVSRLTGVSVSEMKSERRTADVVRPRQVACWAIKKLTPLSWPRIGRLMGGRDHTTILHAVRKVDLTRQNDTDFRRMSDEVLSECYVALGKRADDEASE